MVSSSLLAGNSEIFAAGWWVMRPLAGMRWCCAIDFWRNCAWSYKLTTHTFGYCWFCLLPFPHFLNQNKFWKTIPLFHPNFVGPASLCLPVRKNFCWWELKLCSRHSLTLKLQNGFLSRSMCKICALFLHKCPKVLVIIFSHSIHCFFRAKPSVLWSISRSH